ncbi:probable sporulation protein, polysaccharide deacetylase family [Paenibacillus sp. 1_12]|uniref:polysaccharide deacetylase family protein n=1 Tax=Paenibacillus sp. 1_12 TaxID=1566278 RepID=UPI0008E9054F|nr:polysaccharide deacetylase family protein [Paenibacillus sp. 1_12]SFL45263.1 probable sporulation protein, polysaccharide deacetylase family [Paenibacillus sp. 1_12]
MERLQVVILCGLFVTATLLLYKSDSIGAFVQHSEQQYTNASAANFSNKSKSSVDTMKQGLQNGDREELLKQIQAEAAKRNIAPVDARLDRVWKAIPGYNGLEVDVEKSVALNEQLLFRNQLRLAMREVEPAVQLEQLGSHPVYKGNPMKTMVSLMINVAWGNEFLPKMLKVLEEEQVHATFFFDGSWLKQNIPTAQLIKEKGHELSNHAYSHKDMSKLSRAQTLAEISKTEKLLTNELGVTNRLFAPPSGDFNQATVDIARELKLTTILWTLDTVDWQKPQPSSIIRKVASRVEPGALILMHPTYSSSEALQEIIRTIKRKKMKLGTVSELISTNRIDEVESITQ